MLDIIPTCESTKEKCVDRNHAAQTRFARHSDAAHNCTPAAISHVHKHLLLNFFASRFRVLQTNIVLKFVHPAVFFVARICVALPVSYGFMKDLFMLIASRNAHSEGEDSRSLPV